jgi:hypothetical protein
VAILRARSGDWFSLTATGYQFPDIERLWNDGDANWLMIRLDASLDGLQWSATDPSLTTGGVARLARWIDDLATGALPAGEVWYGSDGPDLMMTVVAADVEPRQIIVGFGGAFRPPMRVPNTESQTVLAVTPAALRRFAAELRAELAAFPVRRVARN